MSQKTNKIILWLGVLLIIGLLIFGLRFYIEKGKKVSVLSPEAINNYYKDCRIYLEEARVKDDDQAVIIPQVFCKVVNNKIVLMPDGDIDIHPGDFVIAIVDVQKLFTENYFNSRNLVLSSQQKNTLIQGKAQFCVSYGPYNEESPLILLPNIFQSPKILDKTAIACQVMSLKYLSPVSIIGTIPRNTQGQPFGLSILLPNKDNVSYTTLYRKFVQIK